MSLFVLGLNHRTAPLVLREKLALGAQDLDAAFGQLLQLDGVLEACILSTCNRTEIYCVLASAAQADVRQWWGQFCRVDEEALASCCYQHQDDEVVQHLMGVAAGLDSLVLGEPQILGQLKQAFETARQLGGIRQLFGRLFPRTFSAAKRVRSQTGIGACGVSVASVAVTLARQIFTDMHQLGVLLIGAGETIELVGRHLHAQKVRQMILANRTLVRARTLAAEWQAEAISLDAIPQRLPEIDIVISATASPLPLLGKGLMERVLKQRRHRPMLLIDLAVPRDIETEVGKLADAYLYTIDDLQGIVAENQWSRQQAAGQAEALIADEKAHFMAWYQALPSRESILRYRGLAEQLQQGELQRARQLLAQGQDAEQVLAELARRLTNKLIHAPTEALRLACEAGDRNTLAILSESLGLNHQCSSEPGSPCLADLTEKP